MRWAAETTSRRLKTPRYPTPNRLRFMSLSHGDGDILPVVTHQKTQEMHDILSLLLVLGGALDQSLLSRISFSCRSQDSPPTFAFFELNTTQPPR